MSKANVEIIRMANHAFRCGDWNAVSATIDPHILVRTDPTWPEQRIYGREAWIAFLRGARESWGPDVRVEEIIDLGDRVLVRLHWMIRARHSGVEGEQRISEIATFREGRVTFIEYFLEHKQALEALEMRE
jgi:ketosteroid isomerase-like protein